MPDAPASVIPNPGAASPPAAAGVIADPGAASPPAAAGVVENPARNGMVVGGTLSPDATGTAFLTSETLNDRGVYSSTGYNTRVGTEEFLTIVFIGTLWKLDFYEAGNDEVTFMAYAQNGSEQTPDQADWNPASSGTGTPIITSTAPPAAQAVI